MNKIACEIYNLEKAFGPNKVLKGIDLKLFSGEIKIGMGIINAFDKRAPLLYDAPDFSFDTRVHDPRGRLINLTLEFNL